MNQDLDRDRGYAAGLVGLAARGLFAVGCTSLVVALVVLFLHFGKDQYGEKFLAVGLCLLASAVSWGALLNGIARR
jgi:hypothetical protein